LDSQLTGNRFEFLTFRGHLMILGKFFTYVTVTMQHNMVLTKRQ